MANNPADGGKVGAASGPAPVAAPVTTDIARVLAAEALGAGVTAFCFVAAGILGERFAGGNVALAMLAAGAAGASAFAVLRLALFGVAPCAFNPALALARVLTGRMRLADAIAAAAAQIAAAVLGVMVAHLVTNTGLVQVATQIQTGPGIWAGEFVAGALFVFAALAPREGRQTPWVGAFSGGFVLLAVSLATPSMSFANPAISLARTLTDSFTAIRLEDAAGIAACQFLGAVAAAWLARWLFPRDEDRPRDA